MERMVLQFFGLRDQPFGVTPDPRFLYLGSTHREAMASLSYGIEAGRGFLAVIAKPGMGKTTLLFRLLEQLKGSARTAFIFQTQCDSRELLRYLLTDAGLDTSENDIVRLHQQFNLLLAREARQGRRFVAVIDEAQNLDNQTLETVRLLSDFETSRTKLLQIVLSGQPQLAEKLASPALAQLRQRISVLSRLRPFNEEEVRNYVEHRLRIAGYRGPRLLTRRALEAVAFYSDGIPRKINNLCFNTLSLACAMGVKLIDVALVAEAASDMDVNSLLRDEANDVVPRVAFAARALNDEWLQPAEPRDEAPAATPLVGLSAPAVETQAGTRPTEHSEISATANAFEVTAVAVAEPETVAASRAIQPEEHHAAAPAGTCVVEPPAAIAENLSSAVASCATPREEQQPVTAAVAESFEILAPAAELPSATEITDYPPEAPERQPEARVTAQAFGKSVPLAAGQPVIAATSCAVSVAEAFMRQSSTAIRTRWEDTVVPESRDQGGGPPALSRQLSPAITSASRNAQSCFHALVGGAILCVIATLSLFPAWGVRPSASISDKEQPAIVDEPVLETKHAAIHEQQTVPTVSARPPFATKRVPVKTRSLLQVHAWRVAATGTSAGRLTGGGLVTRVDPVYPVEARRAGIGGTVVLGAVVDNDGSVKDVKVLNGIPMLAEAAVDAVQQWRYRPHFSNGKPTEADLKIWLEFEP
jgi:general secretion pathway protein A